MSDLDELVGGSFDLTNVQDVVRHMFEAITRTLKQHNAALAKVEQRSRECPSRSEVERMVHDGLTNSSLSNGLRDLTQRVHDKPVGFAHLQEVCDRLQARVQVQESTISSLTSKIENLTAELSSARIQSPKLYVDKQLTSLEDRIAEQIEELQAEKQQHKHRGRGARSIADPTQFETLLNAKADATEIRVLEAKLLDRTTRDEMQHAISAQLRPLIAAVSSIEKLVQIASPYPGLSELPYGGDLGHPDISPTPPDDVESPVHARGPWRQSSVSYPRIQQMVEDAVKQLDSEGGGRVTHAQLQANINSTREGLLRAIDTQLHGVRTQVVDDIQHDMDAMRNEMLTRISEIKVLASGTKDSLERTQTEMVRVLNKKAYKSEVQRLLQDKVDRGELDTCAKEAVMQQLLRAKADLSVCEDEFTRTNHALSRQNHDINELRAELRREVERIALKLAEKANADDLQGFKLSTGAAGDWKTLAINLRREVAEKASKEDLSLTFAEHTEAMSEKLAKLVAIIEEKAACTTVDAIDEHVTQVDRRISTELLGGRWLWRSGRVHKGGWVPWEVEVLNSAPESFQWKREVAWITTIVPGLYHVCVGFFTNVPSTVQLCVNGEPVFTLEPTDQSSNVVAVLPRPENQYQLRRTRHSAGDVSCVCIDEYLALPAQATIAARFTSTVRAQGFLSLRKL